MHDIDFLYANENNVNASVTTIFRGGNFSIFAYRKF